jgi:acid phosphatase family membrane protein YuiD
LESLLTNKIIWVPATAWVLAQVLKVVVASIRQKRFMLSYLTTMGGMPSSHAALVCALATTVAVIEGFGSPLFAVTAFFALIVMYDATGVRQTVGNQSVMLNRMLDELFKGKAKVNPQFEQRLRELIGHTNFQVIAGAALGIVCALIFS